MRIVFALVAVVGVLGCGSGDSSGDKACKDLTAKLDQCQFTTPATCNPSQPCAVECAAKADCSQLIAATPTGSYLACLAACSGAGPNDFVCKDGSGFVNKAGVCDGRFQCQDGSDEAGCGGKDAGSGGASNGSGGASASGGAAQAGSGTSSLDGGVAPSASPECEAMVDHELVACPSLTRADELAGCARDTLLYAPEGCGAAWSAFLACEAKAPFSCDQGPSGCDTQQNGYIACQSQFVQNTGCTRLDNDTKCSGATPYLFACLGSIPSSCVALPPTGGAPIACCPTFPAP